MNYSVVRSSIDGKWRVMLTEDAPYGCCYSVGNSKEDAIKDACTFLGIKASQIKDW